MECFSPWYHRRWFPGSRCPPGPKTCWWCHCGGEGAWGLQSRASQAHRKEARSSQPNTSPAVRKKSQFLFFYFLFFHNFFFFTTITIFLFFYIFFLFFHNHNFFIYFFIFSQFYFYFFTITIFLFFLFFHNLFFYFFTITIVFFHLFFFYLWGKHYKNSFKNLNKGALDLLKDKWCLIHLKLLYKNVCPSFFFFFGNSYHRKNEFHIYKYNRMN